ncbi:MAG: polysaccharide biosynthesis tyrosine autokinase [Planctomycetota bacterium]|nr:polysaccharide biosynthesis tyrosine autokinase [Planctomycetota bacterium]
MEATIIHAEQQTEATSQIVQSLWRFGLTVRYRKKILLGTLLVAVLLGGFYYATATRYYGAKAALVVTETGSDQSSIDMTGEGNRQLSAMPTYRSLITCPKVLEGALDYLRPEDCVDMGELRRDKWAGVIHANLSASIVRGTNIIEISYLSKDPDAAVRIVEAVVRSYRDYLNRTHRGAAGDICRTLTKRMVEIEAEITRKEQETLAARSRMGDIRFHDDGRIVHPLVQRAASFNEELIRIQKERIQLETSLAAIEKAVANGEDLQQHMMSVANVVGKEMLLRSLGFNPRDAATQATLERDLLDERAELKTMHEYLAAAHPEVLAKLDKIRMKEEYLYNYPQRINQWLTRIQDTQLRPKLVRMVSQKLDETRSLESTVQKRYEQSRAEANRLNVELATLENNQRDLKRLRSWNEELLKKITDINLKQEGQEVRTEITQDPVAAASPMLPNRRRVALFALLAGLLLGLAGVHVADSLDDRFRGMEEIEAQLNISVLAMVRQLEATEATGIGAVAMHSESDAVGCEAFRTLRTALSLADRDARRIVVSSAEPGDGKTTVLVNLAVAHARSRKKTLLIDADLRRPGLTAMLDMRGMEGLSSVLRGDRDVVEMAVRHTRRSGIEGLDVLPAGLRPNNPAELLAHERFSELLAWAETVYDQILIDSPPALAASDTAVIGRLIDGVVLVVQPEKNCRRQVIRAAESFTAMNIPLLGVVLNRLSDDHGRGYYGYGHGYGYTYDYRCDDDQTDDVAVETLDDIVDRDKDLAKI